MPDYGTTGGKDAGEIMPHKRLNETTADSGTGSANAGESYDLTISTHELGMDV
ncbi:MAG: hypothetical protein HQM09_24155 [Candidatus Riflebacteria bacterium]|nr:hypothetical protein [Candidatus Riflebacteria bacterium]